MIVLRVLAPLFLITAPLAACSPVGTAIGVGAAAGTAMQQERGFGQAVEDNRIELAIDHLLFAEDGALYARVRPVVHDGRVLLVGAVRDEDDRATALRLAGSVRGVLDVVDELQIAPDYGLGARARDEAVTAELRARLLMDGDVYSSNYDLETVDGVVYLFGLARDAEERSRVAAHAAGVAYVRDVVDHVMLRDDPRRLPRPPAGREAVSTPGPVREPPLTSDGS